MNYRESKNKQVVNSATCQECNSKSVLFKGGSIICRDCDHVIFSPDKKYGEKRKQNTDYSKKRTCQKCSKEYYKDRRVNNSLWSRTKYCSPKCQAAARRLYKNENEGQRVRRRKAGIVPRDSQANRDKISKMTRLAMQRPEVQEKIRQPRNALTLEHRMKVSNALAGKMPLNNSYNNTGYANIKRGYYDINGDTMYFRSKWEANYALYLDFLIDHKEIIKWEFEPDTFIFDAIKLGTRSYTPDFKVFTKHGHEYHEVKGYMDSKSKTKLKRFAKYYPDEKLLLIDSSEYNLIKKEIGKMLKFY